MQLDARSERALQGVHPDLAAIVRRAAEMTPPGLRWIVTEGCRTLARQRELVRQGASKTLRSRHLTGHAIDVCVLTSAGRENWANEAYVPVARLMKRAAEEMGISIEWGGDWKSFVDTPHFQLPWATYPAEDHVAHARRTAPGGSGRADAGDGGRGWTTVVSDSGPPDDADDDAPGDTRPPIEHMGQSKTGNAAIAMGTIEGPPNIGMALSEAAAASSTPKDFLVALLASPKFWMGVSGIALAVFIWAERRFKLIKWGI